MSGGSYNYIYSQVRIECEDSMFDPELNEMIHDLCQVLHDLEWWQSGDIGEDEYRKTVSQFKKKWFEGDRQERLKGYIDSQIGIVRRELYQLIGEDSDDND